MAVMNISINKACALLIPGDGKVLKATGPGRRAINNADAQMDPIICGPRTRDAWIRLFLWSSTCATHLSKAAQRPPHWPNHARKQERSCDIGVEQPTRCTALNQRTSDDRWMAELNGLRTGRTARRLREEKDQAHQSRTSAPLAT